MSQTFVVKLGGSAFSKEDDIFDFEYIKKFRAALEPAIAEGNKFFIVVGGGYTMRHYRDMARKAGLNEDIQLHWIGTTVNVLHAEILRAFLHDIADERIVIYEDYYNQQPLTIEKSLKIGGGGRPGHSGDVDANKAALRLGAKVIYSLKNVDAIYDKDPAKFSDAQPLENISWNEYLEIIGNKTEHEPGGNYPIDPIASREAQQENLEYRVLLANDLENFKNALKSAKFKGTIVTNS